MKLIRKLGRRKNKTGHTISWGLFWCSYCSQEVEKRYQDGVVAKSCGCVWYELSANSRIGSIRSEETRQKMKDKHRDCSGKNNPMYGKIGESSPNWQNGISFEIYPQEFNKELKQQILERDNYICQDLNCEDNHNKLHIHHIDYDKQNNNPKNLITLCHSCHAKTIGKKKRNYYTEFYQNIMINRSF